MTTVLILPIIHALLQPHPPTPGTHLIINEMKKTGENVRNGNYVIITVKVKYDKYNGHTPKNKIGIPKNFQLLPPSKKKCDANATAMPKTMNYSIVKAKSLQMVQHNDYGYLRFRDFYSKSLFTLRCGYEFLAQITLKFILCMYKYMGVKELCPCRV